MWDFLKAYDRLVHLFIWAVLKAMGFIPFFIQLVQGLIVGESLVIHANGLFSRVVDLSWGVRQGCSLSPFLFALTSQPLMAILRQRADAGLLKGIPLSATNNKQLLFQLFVDDIDMFLETLEENFLAVRQTLSLFERIFGARLKMEKSIVMPFDEHAPLHGWRRLDARLHNQVRLSAI